VKNIFQLVLLIAALSTGINSLQAQLSSTDFQHVASISDSLAAPTRMAIDHNDNLYVADSYLGNIKKYASSGSLLETLSFTGTPLSLAVNSNNVLFVGDGISGNILKVNSNGTTTVFFSGSVCPNSMSFSPDNHLYIADSKLKKIIVLNASGVQVQTIGEGNLFFPTGIAFDAKNNRVIVGEHGAVEDYLQTRVYIYDLSGNVVNVLGGYGNSDGKFYRIQGITVGRCGNIYVCEPFLGNICVFNENGAFITRFGVFGTAAGELNVPMDVVFDSQERVLLTSMNNGKLEVFTINDPLPSASIPNAYIPLCEGQSTSLPVSLTGNAPWTLTYTLDGQNPVTLNNIVDNPFQLLVSQPGNYKITAVADSSVSGYCFSGSATVAVNVTATAQIVGGSAALCMGETAVIPVQLAGDSPWSLTYTRNGLNPTTISDITENPYLLEVADAGTYEISAVSGPACLGNVLDGTATITVNEIPSMAFPTFSDSICDGKIVNIPLYFTGLAPWTFEYRVDGMNPVLITTSSNPYVLVLSNGGAYSITSLGDANCQTSNISGMVNLYVIPKQIPDFNFDVNKMTASFANYSQNASSYYWSFGDGKSSVLENPVHKYKFPGTYKVTLSAKSPVCKNQVMTQFVTIQFAYDTVVETTTALEKNELNALSEIGSMQIRILPNPSRGMFNLEISDASQASLSVEIMSLTGQQIYKKSIEMPEVSSNTMYYSGQIDISQYADGIYVVKVISADAVKTAKLVLSKN